MDKRVTLQDHGINWMWYLECTMHANDTITIHRHYRMHKYRDTNHPIAEGNFRLNEDNNRIVLSVIVEGDIYNVTNPKHIFGYSE